jgi:hypothetical protein
MIRSQIFMQEAIDNSDRRFGAAARYYPVYVMIGGHWKIAFLTYDQIHDALKRGEANPEDHKPRAGVFGRIWLWIKGRV